MELSFEYYSFLKDINEFPILAGIYSIIAILIIVYIFRSFLTLFLPLKRMVFFIPMFVTFCVGFVVTIISIVSRISGVKLLLIWCVLFLAISIFYSFNHKMIKLLIKERFLNVFVKGLIEKDISIDMIITITGLTEEEIKAL